MKIKKVELKDVAEENILLPKTSLEMVNHCPLSVAGGTVRLGGDGNFVYIDSSGSDVNFQNFPGNHLSINGDFNIVAKQNIKINGTPLSKKNVDNAFLKIFPTMSIFGLICPSNARHPSLLGMRVAYTSENGEVAYKIFVYYSKEQSTDFLVPGIQCVLLKDVDTRGDYVFVPLCASSFPRSNA